LRVGEGVAVGATVMTAVMMTGLGVRVAVGVTVGRGVRVAVAVGVFVGV